MQFTLFAAIIEKILLNFSKLALIVEKIKKIKRKVAAYLEDLAIRSVSSRFFIA